MTAPPPPSPPPAAALLRTGQGEGHLHARALCARLGLGACSVAQLVSALNRWFGDTDGEKAVDGVLRALA